MNQRAGASRGQGPKFGFVPGLERRIDVGDGNTR